MDPEGKFDLRPPVSSDLDMVAKPIQMAAQIDGVRLHPAKTRRKLGQDEEETRNLLPRHPLLYSCMVRRLDFSMAYLTRHLPPACLYRTRGNVLTAREDCCFAHEPIVSQTRTGARHVSWHTIAFFIQADAEASSHTGFSSFTASITTVPGHLDGILASARVLRCYCARGAVCQTGLASSIRQIGPSS